MANQGYDVVVDVDAEVCISFLLLNTSTIPYLFFDSGILESWKKKEKEKEC